MYGYPLCVPKPVMPSRPFYPEKLCTEFSLLLSSSYKYTSYNGIKSVSCTVISKYVCLSLFLTENCYGELSRHFFAIRDGKSFFFPSYKLQN